MNEEYNENGFFDEENTSGGQENEETSGTADEIKDEAENERKETPEVNEQPKFDQNQQRYYQNNGGYQYNYNPYQQYRPNPYNTETKQKNTGVVVAIIAAVLSVVIIFGCLALIVGLMIKNGANIIGRDTEPYVSSVPDDKPEDTKKNNDRQPSDTGTAETKQSIATDPSATIKTGTAEKTYSMVDVAAMTVNSVVEIRTEQVVNGTFMQQYVSTGAGSGIIVTEDGYIATNNHVISGATSITVILRNGNEYEGKLVGTDASADVAVVKINAKGLEPATFGDSEKLVVAQSVIAIGNPLGELGGSVTDGIISALARTVTVENQEMTLMQTTAAINPGNSGGGLFNMSGECIGIVNAKSSGEDIEGIGFAIPSNTAVPIIEDLIKYGYVRGRVMLGVTMLEVNDASTARRYRVSDYGVYISSVSSGSDAEKAGLKEKDRIVSVNGTDITTYAQFKKMIEGSNVGDTMEIVVSRDGEHKTLKVTFTEYIPK